MIYNRKLGRLEQAMEILNSRAKTWSIVTISRIKGLFAQIIVSFFKIKKQQRLLCALSGSQKLSSGKK